MAFRCSPQILLWGQISENNAPKWHKVVLTFRSAWVQVGLRSKEQTRKEQDLHYYLVEMQMIWEGSLLKGVELRGGRLGRRSERSKVCRVAI